MNILIDYLLLFAYLLFSAYAFGVFFNKNFYESLAPSILFHTLMTICLGIIFNDLRVGLYFVLLLYLFFIIYRHIIKKEKFCITFFNKDFTLFVLFYIFICILNVKREFFHWDEFSHWGMFVKESFRLNKYFSLSNIVFSHKDYVSFPSITLYIFLKITGRYTEPVCYTGMTLLMYSLIMPILSYTKIDSKSHFPIKYLKLFFVFVILMTIPYFFSTSDFYFFISIMPDYCFGTVLFYCLYVAMQPNDNLKYKSMLFILSSVLLLTSRMEGIAYYPLICIFYLYNLKISFSSLFKTILCIILPIIFWLLFRMYIGQYVIANGIQSFNSFSINEVLNVLTLNSDAIPYIRVVLNNYIHYLFHVKIFLYAPFIHCAIFLFVVIMVYSIIKKDKKLVLFSVFVLCAFIYKVVLQFFLYSTRFGEGEAIQLASYGRYMTSFIVAFVYFDLLLITSNSNIGGTKIYTKLLGISYLLVLLVTGVLSIIELKKYFTIDNYKMSIYGSAVRQYIPGFLKNNHENNEKYIALSKSVLEHSDSRVILILDDYSNMWERINLQYQTDGYSIDVVCLNDYDNIKTFISKLSEYDYFVTVNNSKYLVDNYLKLHNTYIIEDYNLYNVNEVLDNIIEDAN